MAIARPILGALAILLLAGGIVMHFFVVLSGLNSSPVNQVYFLQSSTNGVSNAGPKLQNPARWTWLNICGVGSNGLNDMCSHTQAALPFDPTRNFQTVDGIPQDFVQHPNYYFYLSRFAWVFYIIALFFAVIGILLSLFALCARLGAYITGLTVFLGMFFQALAAALMTAWVVKGRNVWRSAGQDAHVGVKAMAFSWAAFACYFIATLFFCVGGAVSGDRTKQKSSYFGRKRSTRSRGSFVDSGSERRGVKDEYD